jgi:hypothetical protein
MGDRYDGKPPVRIIADEKSPLYGVKFKGSGLVPVEIELLANVIRDFCEDVHRCDRCYFFRFHKCIMNTPSSWGVYNG